MNSKGLNHVPSYIKLLFKLYFQQLVQTYLLKRQPDADDVKGVTETREHVKISLKIIDKLFLTKVSYFSVAANAGV